MNNVIPFKVVLVVTPYAKPALAASISAIQEIQMVLITRYGAQRLMKLVNYNWLTYLVSG